MHPDLAEAPPRPVAPSLAPDDHAIIRGRRVPLDRLVDRRRLTPAGLASLRQSFLAAEPFPHLVIDGLFDRDLLELVRDEFDLLDDPQWRSSIDGELERTLRSGPGVRLGAAAELYFGVLHAGWFVDALTQITAVQNLIVDAHLHNGGFHEARSGGRFAIHTDFVKHPCNGLDNELVLITYLNEDWDPNFHGALELWSAATRRAATRVEPLFGRSILMRQGPTSLHGHPTPLQLPPDRVRRSVAAYYYSNRHPSRQAQRDHTSAFLQPGLARALRFAARDLTPPLLWRGLKRLIGR